MMQRQHRKYRLHPACPTQEVARHGLGRIDHQLFGVVSEGSLDGLRLVLVAQGRGGAMRIDVADGLWPHAGISERRQHAAPWAVHIGCSHVKGIA